VLLFVCASASLAQTRARPGGGGGGGDAPPPDPAIAYADNGISVMNADGTNARQLVSLRRGDLARSPAWSPDSTEVVYWGRAGGVAGIRIVPVAGGASRLVTTTADASLPAWPDWSPVPAPDGLHKIAYVERDLAAGSADIYLVNPDGTGRVNLTMSPEHYESGASWAPDGARLIVARDSVEVAVLEIGVVDGQLAVIGETVYPLTDLSGAFPRWSKTGEDVAFCAWVDFRFRIALMNVADPFAVPTLLTSGPVTDERWASFSPDDSRLAFHRSGTGGGIFVINADGTGEVRISSRGSDPNWRRTP
jgi:Tol biopolymer transport system component